MDSQTPQQHFDQSKRIESLEAAVRTLLRHANFTSDSLMYIARGEPFREVLYVRQDVSQEFGVPPASTLRLPPSTQIQQPSIR